MSVSRPPQPSPWLQQYWIKQLGKQPPKYAFNNQFQIIHSDLIKVNLLMSVSAYGQIALPVNQQCMTVNLMASECKYYEDDHAVMIPPTLKNKLIYEEE